MFSVDFFKKYKSKIIITAIIIAVIMILSVVCIKYLSNNFSYQLYKNGVTVQGVKNFKIAEKSPDMIMAERNQDVVKIKFLKNYNQNQADNFIKNQILALQELFNPQLPPYPEFLTQKNACSDKYYPVKYESDYGNFYILFSNNRLGYGVCADDLIGYKSGLGLFYCKNKNEVVKLEFFTDSNAASEKIENFMTSFECR